MSFKLLVVIPTRNRPDLAINAIRSAIEQSGTEFEVIVSDNSTDEANKADLMDHCRGLGDDRVRYIAPEEPLPMTKHWEWAMRQSLRLSDFTHVTYLTDRTVFKNFAFSRLDGICGRFPDKLITYRSESIYDEEGRVRLEQTGATGRIFELTSDLLIDSFLTLDWVSPFPAMLNSCVPRQLVETIAELHGEIFSSISPDFNFGFKVLDLVDSILHIDETLLVSYGNKFSNGINIAKGTFTNDASADFTSRIDKADIYIDSILPFGTTIVDAVLNEYFYIRKNAKKRSFPLPDERRYKAYVIRNLLQMDNQELKARLLADVRKKYGAAYAALYLRAKLPLKRYVRRVIEEAILKIRPASEPWVIKHFPDYAAALQYAKSNSAPPIDHTWSFYKRTSIVPAKVRQVPA